MPKLKVAKIGEDGKQFIDEIDTEAKPEPVELYTGMEDLIAALQVGEEGLDDWVLREVDIRTLGADILGDAREALHPLVASHFLAADKRRMANATRGAEIREAARQGHEAVHGTKEQKHLRWRNMASAFAAERKKPGRNNKAAEYAVAAEHGVSTRTVRAAVKWAREN